MIVRLATTYDRSLFAWAYGNNFQQIHENHCQGQHNWGSPRFLEANEIAYYSISLPETVRGSHR